MPPAFTPLYRMHPCMRADCRQAARAQHAYPAALDDGVVEVLGSGIVAEELPGASILVPKPVGQGEVGRHACLEGQRMAEH